MSALYDQRKHNQEMTILDFIISLRPAVPFSTERPCKEASNSEIRRWLKNHSISINGERLHDPNEPLDFPVFSLVFFPNSKRKTTIV